jgi:hypothetical protein
LVRKEVQEMGRTIPEVQLPQSVVEEVVLARAIDEAVAHVLATRRVSEQDLAAAVQRVLADRDGALDGAAAAAAVSAIQQQAVALDSVEVTQEVQDLDHSIPLVVGKTTIVRAYLSYPQAVSVRGELQVARTANGPWQTVTSLGPAQLDPSRSGGSPAQLRSRRADLAFSLNFRLPAELTAAGDLWLRMGQIQRTTGTALPSLAGLTTRTVTFQRAAPLRLRLVRLRYTMGSPPRAHEPSGTDVTLITSWLHRAYPIATLDVTTTTATAMPRPTFEAAQINAQLIALRAVDVATGTDARMHYYGMVADSGFFMRGLASAIPQTPRPGTVASGPTGPGTFGWDSDGSYGDWYGGHELGHTFGRFHAEFCGAGGGAPYPFPNGQLSGADEKFVGIDVGDPALGLPMRVLRGTTSHDVMTYCNNQWLSGFTYRGIFDRLTAEDALPAGPGSGPAARIAAGMATAAGGTEEPEAPAMRLIAALNLTRSSGSITAVLPVSGGAEEGEATGAEPYDVTIRIRDAEGTTLDERRASFQPSACEDPDEDVTGVVDMDVPTPAGAATLEVLVGGQVVDRQPVGGEAVPLGTFTGADQEAAGAGGTPGAVELRWEQPDAPAGQRYIVQLSDDGGATWRTVAVGLTEPAVSLPRDELTGDEITVRVLATTGSGAALVRTDTVRVR